MHPVDAAIVGLYLAALVVAGLWMRRAASRDLDAYFLGRRSMPWWMLGSSGMASNLDLTGTMINTALVFALGVSGFFVEIRGGVVLVMALLMVFMGKWNRRAGVMTFAEWMALRFGASRQGDAARLVAALGSILLTVAMVTYFATGAGRFVADVLGLPAWWGAPPRFWGALGMMGLALVYTASSGFYGVVVTDLVQSALIFAAIAGVAALALSGPPLPEAFPVSSPLRDGGFQVHLTTREAWTGLVPPWRMDFGPESGYSSFELFGVAIAFYLVRTLIEGFGGSSGYMAQRFFAARDDREAGLLSLLWTFLLSFRWLFVASVAVLGVAYGQSHAPIEDPEAVLPVVLLEVVPAGLRGLLLAALMAAAMSTFDSTVNAGASFWVRDVYQAYLRPGASDRDLVRQGRWSSVAIVASGALLSLTVNNINEIWGWITMSIGVGLLIPSVVRWYWWRMNGCGFAVGTAAGMAAAVAQRALFPEWPEYAAFSAVALAALAGVAAGSWAAPPTPGSVLEAFYRRTRPFGLWGPVRRAFDAGALREVDRRNRRDLLAAGLAVPWQLSLFLLWMMLAMRRWDAALALGLATAVLSAGLHRLWYRHLDERPVELGPGAGRPPASRNTMSG